ncbi:MAG: putative divalent ion tolerance protein [Sphingomonas bacterium]|jgi:periplasmic divalent cation tolerance protein|nr:divalent-cation tolerance protein CutA [Sphingomonas bacterium]MDB5690651.1 putative divalent ion tolerance protein [Sphingomonas bacterium]
MTGIATVYALFPSADEADRIGRMMIEERLAACVNILAPCRSIYRWDGAIETGEEVPALFKTRADGCEALVERIAALHSYAVPAVMAWPIDSALPAYAAWVKAMVS